MTSARTQCPECHGTRVAALNAILFSPNADFFRCEDCGHLWHVQKGQDGPASRSLLGTVGYDPSTGVNVEKPGGPRVHHRT